MLPGKKYKPEDVLQVLRRRRWFLLVPFAVVSAAAALGARMLPDRYRSETLILVVPQRVPESYVKSTVTARIEDRLHSIRQQILSRTRLEQLITEFNLYADERRTQIMEDIVERMRLDIDVQVVRGDAFRVSYIGDSPRTVMKVTERLAAFFIEENLRDREVLAEGTNQFLEAQLEDARRRLIEHEKKLEVYRKQFSGQLPSQLESNIQVIQNTQLQIQSVVESLNRDRERRLLTERQRAEAERQAAIAPAVNGSSGVLPVDGETTAGSAAQQLNNARATLAALRLRLTEEHPDIQRVKRVIRDLEKKAEAELADGPVSADATPATGNLEAHRRLRELRLELQQLDQQIAYKEREEKRLRGIAAGYQQRVEKVPTRESEMAELTRDYDTLQTIYRNLLTKKEESKVAANLERRQIGEQFKLLDPARLPEKPFSPNRQRLNLLGMLAGLGLGIGLIALLEYRDSSFRNDEEITATLTLPVLAVVPLMRSIQERRRELLRRVMVDVVLGATVIGCVAVVAYTFLR